jgi:hypothetical protein
MLWAPFLHIYQPPTQYRRILKEITVQSYAPLVETFERNPKAKATINIPASLTEQMLEAGYFDLIKRFSRLVERGQLELTGTAAYHPLLTRLPEEEIRRQVELNEEINSKHFGVFKPRGFFPPEMAYSRRVGEILSRLGYDWALLGEVTYAGRGKVRRDVVYRLRGNRLGILFRHHELSLAIAFGKIESADQFVQKTKNRKGYAITAMDGETFGHHHPHSFTLLNDLYRVMESVTISELLTLFPDRVETDPLECTWAASKDECQRGIAYPRWDSSESPLHSKQWELYFLAIELVRRSGTDGEERVLLDKALHSDQFWWASRTPFWHPGMVERGAKMLLRVIKTTPGVSKDERRRAEKLYDEIVNKGLKMYGDKPVTH